MYVDLHQNCREYCFGLLGLISAMLMLGWRLSKVAQNDPTNVVSSKPCQTALTSKLVSMRSAKVMRYIFKNSARRVKNTAREYGIPRVTKNIDKIKHQ